MPMIQELVSRSGILRRAVVSWMLLIASVAGTRSQEISIGKNVQISTPKSHTDHMETTACADPANPLHLIAASMYVGHYDAITGSNIAVYTSVDGGSNWSLTLDTAQVADPTCAYGPDGVAYFTMMKFDGSNEYKNLDLYRSADGGKNWSSPIVLSGDHSFDRPWISVDGSGGIYRGRVYINASGVSFPSLTDPSPLPRPYVEFLYSSDGGKSFITDQGLLENGTFHDSGSVVLADGTVVVSYYPLVPEAEPNSVTKRSRLKALVSSDGGRTFSGPFIVSRGSTSGLPGSHVSADLNPSLAADLSSGKFRDRVYIVWTDMRSGRAQTWFSYSSDKGRTWSSAKPLNQDRPFDRAAPEKGPDEINPVVAVNKNGIIGVMWCDRRDTPEKGYWPRFTASLDGGETWTPSVRISEKPFQETRSIDWFVRTDLSSGTNKPRSIEIRPTFGFAKLYRPGDTSGLAADAAGVFHPVWIDDRTGAHQVWTAPITVTGAVTERNDITDKTQIEVTDFSTDDVQQVIRISVRLKNISATTVRGPFLMEIVDLPWLPPGYETYVTNATNGLDGVGAVWDFAASSKDASLSPGEVSSSRELKFRYASPEKEPVVTLKVRVLGRPSS